MLDCTAANLVSEIEAAEQFRDEFLKNVATLIERYTGGKYRADLLTDDNDKEGYTPENHAYEWNSLVVPKIISNSPRVLVQGGLGDQEQLIGIAFKHAINKWARDYDLRAVLVRMAVDMSFSMCAALVSEGNQPGYFGRDPSVPQWPVVTRISPKRFIMDPLAQSFDECRFVGHLVYADKEDLIDRARDDDSWIEENIQMMASPGDNDGSTVQRKAGVTYSDRNQVGYYEMWIPEKRQDGAGGPDEGFHGSIYTIAANSGQGQDKDGKGKGAHAMIRKPRAYYGPRTGPYAMGGAYCVPDVTMPLSPLVATAEQAEELNKCARSISKDTRDYKRIVLVDAANPSLVQKVQNDPHNYVIAVKGFRKDDVQAVEIGGITQQQLAMLEIMRDRLDRTSGLHDAQRGNITGGTATEVSVADSSANVRINFIKRQFVAFVQEVLRKAGWFIFSDDRIAFPLGEDADKELGMQGVIWHGGENEDGTFVEFDDLNITLEPYSMEFTDEAMMQGRWQQVMSIVAMVAPMVIQFPYVDWQRLLDTGGETLNYPNLGKLIDIQLARQMAAQGQLPAMMGDMSQGMSMAGTFGRQPGQVNSGSRLPAQRPMPKLMGANDQMGQARSNGQMQYNARSA